MNFMFAMVWAKRLPLAPKSEWISYWMTAI
jgi:hypothetical protein